MATIESAVSGSPENKTDRTELDAKYPLKVLYCGGKTIFFSLAIIIGHIKVSNQHL